MPDDANYAIESNKAAGAFEAPILPYLPRKPKSYRPNLALIACGGVTHYHLRAYRDAGFNVVALCDTCREKAEGRQKEFFPEARIYTDYQEVLRRDDIEVLDVATHPQPRVQIITDALNARKHVLSQKPFVTDLDAGRRLIDLADQRGVKLAVNQNGRWAPHFSYIRQAIAAGVIGDVVAVHHDVHWDHNWIKGMEFENVRHIILYDFAIHWFDILTNFMGAREPSRVYASFTRSPGQWVRPNLLGQALVEYEAGQATLAFDGDTRFGQRDRTFVSGTKGTLCAEGPDLGNQAVTLFTERGAARPKLEGGWFTNGFQGTMGELLCAIEEGREPSNAARDNLRSLALSFAAIESAETHVPVAPGTVTKLPA
jgi:predicted dehydrogenase